MTNIFKRFELEIHARREPLATATRDGIELRAYIKDDDDCTPDYLGSFAEECAQPATFSFEHKPNDHHSYNWFNAENVENREQARQNYDRACAFGESWVFYAVEVRAYKAGVELAREALWGIESDSDESYFLETANDMASLALDNAKKKITELNSEANHA